MNQQKLKQSFDDVQRIANQINLLYEAFKDAEIQAKERFASIVNLGTTKCGPVHINEPCNNDEQFAMSIDCTWKETFVEPLRQVINKMGLDAICHVKDIVLAEYLHACIINFNNANAMNEGLSK
jgi:hypothetical protein